MCVLLRTYLSLLLVLILDSTHLTALQSCPRRCGNLTKIPYPFGIGKGCYLNGWFEIQCNNSTSGEPIPYLPKINKEVVGINLPTQVSYLYVDNPYGSLRIKTKITSMGCSNNSDEIKFGEPLNFTGTPFTIGASNTLIALGCNNKATLTHLEPRLVGCITTCNEQRKKGDNLGCNGNKCCQAEQPSEVRNIIGVSIEDISSNFTRECRVAFLTDEFRQVKRYLNPNPQWFYERQYVILQLRWAIPMTNLSFIKSLGCGTADNKFFGSNIDPPCKCDKNSFSDISCACGDGYIGNPYRLGGCEDIDECLDKSICSQNGGPCVNTPGSYHCEYKKEKTLDITIGLCVGFGVLILFGVTFWLYNFINRKNKFFKRNGGLLLKQQLTSTEGSIEKIKVFNSKELKKATENFSSNRVLGQGGQGTVYKGMLVDGRIVAVKKSKVVDEDKLEEFINEVVILSQINHRNIVKLIGCCLETRVPLLVYEFVSNGNLFEHLHDEFGDYTMATWGMRLRIAIDIAGALSYLHSAASSPIYHRDIKSTNIIDMLKFTLSYSLKLRDQL